MTDSLIGPISPTAGEDETTPPGGESPPAGDEDPDKKLDPFGDLADYRDPENQLFLGKYKTIKDVFDGYKALTGKLRERVPEAPEKVEDYAFEFADEALKDYRLTVEDPMWGKLAPIFKEANVSQEQAQKIVEGYLKAALDDKADLESERQKLGAEAEQVIGAVVSFAQKRGTPGAAALAELAGQSAEALKELHALVQASGERSIPGKLDGVQGRSPEDLKAEAFAYREKHKDIIDSSPAHQQVYENMLKQAIAAGKRK